MMLAGDLQQEFLKMISLHASWRNDGDDPIFLQRKIDRNIRDGRQNGSDLHQFSFDHIIVCFLIRKRDLHRFSAQTELQIGSAFLIGIKHLVSIGCRIKEKTFRFLAIYRYACFKILMILLKIGKISVSGLSECFLLFDLVRRMKQHWQKDAGNNHSDRHDQIGDPAKRFLVSKETVVEVECSDAADRQRHDDIRQNDPG